MSLVNKDILLGELNNAYVFFERSTGSLTEEDSGFAPAGGAFTAANQVAHAAQTIDWFMQGAFDPNASIWTSRRTTAASGPCNLFRRRARGCSARVENARALVANRNEDEWARRSPTDRSWAGCRGRRCSTASPTTPRTTGAP